MVNKGDAGQFSIQGYKVQDNDWYFRKVKGVAKGMGNKSDNWVIALEKRAKKIPGVGSHHK